jgi:hypothetical protein
MQATGLEPVLSRILGQVTYNSRTLDVSVGLLDHLDTPANGLIGSCIRSESVTGFHVDLLHHEANDALLPAARITRTTWTPQAIRHLHLHEGFYNTL